MTTQNWSEDPVVLGIQQDSNTADTSTSTSSTATDQAKDLGRDGAEAAKDVAQTAGTEAKKVAGEASAQAKNLLGELGSDLKSQAGEQQQKVTESLRALSDELKSMAGNTDEDGPAKHLVQQAADRTGSAAGWLEGRDPGSLLEEVKGFARTRPGTFLLLAAGAGVLAGRLTRGITGAEDSEPGTDTGSASTGSADHRSPETIYPPTENFRTPAHAAEPVAVVPVVDTVPEYPAAPPATPLDDGFPGRREIR